jgi:hypothetical protein
MVSLLVCDVGSRRLCHPASKTTSVPDKTRENSRIKTAIEKNINETLNRKPMSDYRLVTSGFIRSAT